MSLQNEQQRKGVMEATLGSGLSPGSDDGSIVSFSVVLPFFLILTFIAKREIQDLSIEIEQPRSASRLRCRSVVLLSSDGCSVLSVQCHMPAVSYLPEYTIARLLTYSFNSKTNVAQCLGEHVQQLLVDSKYLFLPRSITLETIFIWSLKIHC